MAWHLVRAGLIGLGLFGVAGAAGAADLNYKSYDKQTYKYEPYAPYYQHRESERYEERRPAEPRYLPAPRRYGTYEEESEPYSRPYDTRRPKYRSAPQYAEPTCIAKSEFRPRLKEHGWHELSEFEVRGDAIHVTARRPDGLTYRLSVDRCTGVILTAELIDDGRGWRRRNYSQTAPY